MADVTTTWAARAFSGRLERLRTAMAQLDFEATSIRLVAVCLAIGIASLLIPGPGAHRNTDTTTERVARITPVGEVRVAANDGAATGAIGAPSAGAGNGS